MELTELLPEINHIKDEDLRGKVISVWQEALEIGGWKLEDLQLMPYTLLVKDVDVTFVEHVRVVCKLCLAMEGVLKEAYGERAPIDHDALVAGALLADVGKLIEFREKDGEYEWSSTYQYLRHPFTGVALSYKHGVPEQVLHVIATHSWEGDKFNRQPESIIFHHADFTDFHLTQFKSQ
jgi:hypothetical protein